MATYFTSAGLSTPTASELRLQLRSAIESRLAAAGLSTDVAWGQADSVWNILVEAVVEGQVDAYQALQSVYNGWVLDNATGTQLDELGDLRGVPREGATFSTATVTFSGTAGTSIPAGFIVEGGGADDDARWATATDATISGGGTVDVGVVATVSGATSAGATEIDALVSSVLGVDSVSNAAAAIAGRDRESDTTYRARIRAARPGNVSVDAIRTALEALDFVTKAIVRENVGLTSTTIGGLTLIAKSIRAVVSPSSLTSDQQDTVAETIYNILAPSVESNGTVTRTVSGQDGAEKTIRFDEASTLTVNVASTLTVAAGYTVAGLTTAVQTAVSDLAATWDLYEGEGTLYATDVQCAVIDVDGVRTASVTLNGGASVSLDLDEIPVLGTNTVA